MGRGEWKGTRVSSIHRGIVSTVSFYVQVLQGQDFSRCPFFPYGIHFSHPLLWAAWDAMCRRKDKYYINYQNSLRWHFLSPFVYLFWVGYEQ